MLTPKEALERLRAGNRRFASHLRSVESLVSQLRRDELSMQQFPIATVLGCSDSRVPVEHVFDQGVGDLFVVRVAGNIVAPSQVGTIEFASERFGTSLAVVLGHSRCGAVLAALETPAPPSPEISPNLMSIVGRVRSAIEPVLERTDLEPEARIHEAVELNVRSSVRMLREDAASLRPLVESGRLAIVGAIYDLASGAVTFLDDLGAAQ